MRRSVFLCFLAFLSAGCDESKDCEGESDSSQTHYGESVDLFSLNLRVERFKVADKDFKYCLKVLNDSLDPRYEFNKRVILIEGAAELEGLDGGVAFDSESNSITLDLQNIPVGELLRCLCESGLKSLSYRVLDDGEVVAIIIAPIGFYCSGL